MTNSKEPTLPNQPDFRWESLSSRNEYSKIKITWLPDVKGNPGTNFLARYRIKGETEWLKTDIVRDNDFIIIDGLLSNKIYEIATVSIDGMFLAVSTIQEAKTKRTGMKFHFF